MRSIGLAAWSAPALLVAFSAVGVDGLNAIFTTSVRWGVLASALLIVLSHGLPRSLYSSAFMMASLAFCGWAITSSIWSEWTTITILKSMAFVAVVIGATGAGYLWVRRNAIPAALDALGPLLVIALIAAIKGRGPSSYSWIGESTQLYQGGTDNPNFLGALSAMAVPLPTWKVMSSTSAPRRIGWALCLVALVVVIGISRSRAALMIVAFIGGGAAAGIGWRRSIPFAVPAAAVLMVVALLMPRSMERVTDEVLYKGSREYGGVLASRQQTWGESYDAALQGGAWGVGYGVSLGSEMVLTSMTSAVHLGREKGNSQLGIVEELGLFGLILYLAGTLALFGLLQRAGRASLDTRGAALVKLLLGTLAGMTAHSIFEAWYNAPGSMECVYYWVMAGMAVGVATDARLRVSGSASDGPRWSFLAGGRPA